MAEVQERADVGERGAPAYRTAPSIARYQFAARWVKGAMTVLDFACGTGYGVAYLDVDSRTKVIGLDNAVDAVRRARQRFGAQGAQFVAGDATAFPFGPATFDMVVCLETIEHVADVDRLLSQIRRVLRPGGTVIFSTPNRLLHSPNSAKPLNPYHVVEYTIEQFRAVLAPQFVIEEIYGQQPQDPARSAALRWAPTGPLRRLIVNLPFVATVFSKGASRFVTQGLEHCRFFFAVCRHRADTT